MPLDFLSPLHKASRQISVYLEAHTRELAESLNALLETFEAEIRECLSAQELEGFRAVMSAVEEVTRVRLRER